MFSYFRGSLLFTLAAVIVGYFVAGPAGSLTVLLLSILETSLSFDNAVFNAGILKNWDKVWQDRFLTWGMPIAVFGMRFVFPLLIVGIAAKLGPIAVVKLAINSPDEYAKILTSTHAYVAAFGGAFLSMIALTYFLSDEKDSHWISFLEEPLAKLNDIKAKCVATSITAGILAVTSVFGVAHNQAVMFYFVGVGGIATFLLVKYVAGLLGDSAGNLVKQGVIGLLYLELIDASLSFDGVIGALAVSNQIFLIMLGLGTGACFVRSLTLLLVDKGTLTEYPYLENGAFYAISALTAIMFISTKVEVPNLVSGLVGAGFIGVALLSSIIENKRANKQTVAAN